jgi:hypothetical protein
MVLAMLVALGAAACGRGPTKADTAAWDDSDSGVYATTIEVVVDELGTGPLAVVFVLDELCADAGQTTASELTCDAAIPEAGKAALAKELADLAPVEFVADAASVASGKGAVERGGVLVWLGPTKDENGGVRVGANYATRAVGSGGAGINLRMKWQHDQWIVTGSAGLGGCPA